MKKMKWKCTKCGENFPRSEFYKDRRRFSGIYAKCKKCHNKVSRNWQNRNLKKCAAIARGWRARHPEQVKARNSEYKKRNKARINLLAKKRRQRSPEKLIAYLLVAKAVETGKLNKPSKCSACHKKKSKRNIHAHHEDYSKPFNVIWLCNRCHSLHHFRSGFSKCKRP